mgnify:CR=1 FL=1
MKTKLRTIVISTIIAIGLVSGAKADSKIIEPSQQEIIEIKNQFEENKEIKRRGNFFGYIYYGDLAQFKTIN